MIRKIAWAGLMTFVATLAMVGAAVAQITQTVTYTSGNTRVYWDAATASTTVPEDQIAGYELAASQVLQTGTGTNVFVRTWAIGNVLTHEIPAGEMPARPFHLSVRAVTVSGAKSAHSNTLLFRDPGLPTAPGNLRRTPAAQ